ncbi:hypothetical protein FA15DRAFT_683052 [Coprinopsis marcescibilis]|uniref:Integrase core domain-containing protein n=1 Tax=Coprinopsis marcescibilis TaxID=230819 RepID=A0A5C3KH37_COPMA|nr:hypothetical protein FA15DRAFT_683052 [Coprinopsis marcescibilis]
MVNQAGNNQWGRKESLLECVRLKYPRKDKIKHLKKEFNLSIGETKLREIEYCLEIPTVRKPRLSKEVIKKTAFDFIKKDITKGTGPHALKSMPQDEHILIARDDLHLLMKDLAPEGFDLSLQMGDISIPIYAYRDKWSGFIIKLVAVPDSRSAAPLGHLYLDLIAECGGVPLQLTTDKGPERGIQQSIQDALRRLFAPDIDPEVFATAMAIMSVHNTVIESLWRWLQIKMGHTLKETILQGKTSHIFQPQCVYHSDLFYWIFIPLIQEALDSFRTYWNHHRVRTRAYKHMPSGHVPADAINMPEKYDPNALNCLIKVPEHIQHRTRRLIEEEVGARDTFFRWFSDDFKVIAETAFSSVGRPSTTLENAWEIFSIMSDAIKVILE